MSNRSREESLGKLYVVGVGPGDPELITVKGNRLLSKVPLVFVPQRDETTPSYARGIVESLTRGKEQKVVPLIFPMTRDGAKLAQHWEDAAATIWRDLRAGHDCAFVNEGDPFLFGTAIYVVATLQKAHPLLEIEIVPGISSINASAARAALPLAIRDEKIAILSGHCAEETTRETLQRFDTVVFIKVDSVFGKLLDILEELSLVESCVYVSKCTSNEERIVRDIRGLRGQKLDYLSLLIMRKRDG